MVAGFAFIICVTNEQYFEEACFYINRLRVPEGYVLDIISIREADSMCAAYNAAMESSDAIYKIYLHQDVFIRNEDFLYDILRIFADERIGLIGVMGGTRMPENGVVFRAWDVGYLDCRDPDMSYYMQGSREEQRDTIVEAVDGLIMVTQYDIPWREDLFEHFDFYDVSQSFEMRRAGYQVFVPRQETPWVIHDSNFAKLGHYDEARQIALREYPDFFYGKSGLGFIYDRRWDAASQEMEEDTIHGLEAGDWTGVERRITEYRDLVKKSSRMETLSLLYDIRKADSRREGGFFSGLETYGEIFERYTMLRFLLRRMELGMEEASYAVLVEMLGKGTVSFDALLVILLHSVVEKKKVLLVLREIYERQGIGIPKLELLLTRISDSLPLTYSKADRRK